MTAPRMIARIIKHAPAVIAALERMEAHDDRLNGTAPTYADAQAPDGDDYNHVMAEAMQLLRIIRGEDTPASSGQMRQPETAKTGPYRTKAEIRMDWKRDRAVYALVIPAGTRCKRITGGSTTGSFWVDDLSWIAAAEGMLKHDATYYGIVLAPELVEQV